MNEVIGYRTRLQPGSAAAYRAVHATIPEPVAAALRASGVVTWRIWLDGETVFHQIETRDGQDAMLARMAHLGTIDPEWDALIATLVNTDPSEQQVLVPVWTLHPDGQSGGQPA